MKNAVLCRFIITLLLIINASHGFSQVKVSGIVKDLSTQEALIGVSIIEKGTSNHTYSDVNGYFEFIVRDSNVIIEIQYIGYETIEKSSSNLINTIMYMVASSPNIEEVIITGYYITQGNFGNRGYNLFELERENTEEYSPSEISGFKNTTIFPHSTFSIDVDKASYSMVRKKIATNQEVPKDAVRIEEMLNYFSYDYPQPQDAHPYSIISEYGICPWNEDHGLLLVALQGKEIKTSEIPASNTVFLIDVSGSMDSEEKLPLVKNALKVLLNNLRAIDKVSIVVYAGAAGEVLPPTSGDKKELIIQAIDKLSAGGSTAGGEGIELAYKIAIENFIEGGNNRIVLCTDGDFNVGVSSVGDLEKLIEEKRKTGVYLSCFGFGMGNYKDNRLETLADKGNGNYGYVDSEVEANKLFGKEFAGTMYTIAKDVKIQVEFNPKVVASYRLIGYSNRLLKDEDFIDDKVDAGEMGAGHSVTALYEIILPNHDCKFIHIGTDKNFLSGESAYSDTVMAILSTRYKLPEGNNSIEYKTAVKNYPQDGNTSSIHYQNLQWASSVAMFGMLLQESPFRNYSSFEKVLSLGFSSIGTDLDGTRAAFLELVKKLKNHP